jgi:hypothetical protein
LCERSQPRGQFKAIDTKASAPPARNLLCQLIIPFINNGAKGSFVNGIKEGMGVLKTSDGLECAATLQLQLICAYKTSPVSGTWVVSRTERGKDTGDVRCSPLFLSLLLRIKFLRFCRHVQGGQQV